MQHKLEAIITGFQAVWDLRQGIRPTFFLTKEKSSKDETIS